VVIGLAYAALRVLAVRWLERCAAVDAGPVLDWLSMRCPVFPGVFNLLAPYTRLAMQLELEMGLCRSPASLTPNQFFARYFLLFHKQNSTEFTALIQWLLPAKGTIS
jgi:hypothetical protein